MSLSELPGPGEEQLNVASATEFAHQEGIPAEVEVNPKLQQLQARWLQYHVESFPVGTTPERTASFANSRRHERDLLCAPEAIDALLAIAAQMEEIPVGSDLDIALANLHTHLDTIDSFRKDNKLLTVPDSEIVAKMRTAFNTPFGYSAKSASAFTRYNDAIHKVRETGTRYLVSQIGNFEDQVVETYVDGKPHATHLSELILRAVHKNTELEEGVQYPRELVDKLKRLAKEGGLLVFSEDINGAVYTLKDQVTACPANIAAINDVTGIIRAYTEEFLPHLTTRFIGNTGMGASPQGYARGVAETSAVNLDDVFGESGNVRLNQQGDATYSELTMDHPEIYLEMIGRIKDRVLTQIQAVEGHGKILVPPKDSMFSIMTHEPRKEGDIPMILTRDGQEVTEQWIAGIVDTCFQEELDTFPSEERTAALSHLRAQVIAKYNGAVGFIDVFNRQINKYTAIEGFIAEQGYTLDNTIYMHIGDSSVDAPPMGEFPEAFILALGNRKDILEKAALRQGDRGILIYNEAIVGVYAALAGLANAIAQAGMELEEERKLAVAA